MINKKIVVFAICLATLFQMSHAENHKPVSVWIFALYSPEIIKSKTKPFFDYVSTQSNFSYRVNSSTDLPRLLMQCKAGKISIVAVSMVIGQQLIEHCNYKIIAKTYQDIHLYKKASDEKNPLQNPATVGLIKGLWATKVAYSEMLNINKDSKAIIYTDFFQLVKQYKQDGVDTIVLPRSVFNNAAPFFEREWVPTHTFKEKGIAAILVSPEFDPKHKALLTKVLLENNEITRKVWQEDIGMGAFHAVTDLEPDK